MKTSAWALTLGLLVLAPSAGFAEESKDSESFLFMELAETAELADGTLTLSGIDDTVQVFADRPYRTTGGISVEDLVGGWGAGENSFAEDPPNAALSGTVDGAQAAIIVELGTPELEADTLRFPVKVLAGDDAASLRNAAMVIDLSSSCLDGAELNPIWMTIALCAKEN